MFPQADAGSLPTDLPRWALKNVTEYHTRRKSIGVEVCDLEAGARKSYINQLRPLDGSKYGENFLPGSVLLPRS